MFIEGKALSGLCSCGRVHSMDTQFVSIQPGCLADFEHYLAQASLTGRRAAIYDENTYNAKGLHRPAADQEIILKAEGLHADEHGTSAVLAQLQQDIDVLIAIGAGTIHDIVRYCANDRGIPFVACPTAASVDGFCSTVSAMTWKGFKQTLPGVAPAIVLADIDVIKEAPLPLALSGVGDIMGKYTALADWKISHEVTGEYFCETIEGKTRDALLAVHNCSRQVCQRDASAFEQLIYGLLLSGLAMQMMGNSRPASGAEHHISHFIEMEPDSLNLHSNALHGEKVGVATALVAGVYHQLAGIADIRPHLRAPRPLTEELAQAIFGQRLVASLMEENREDCIDAVKPDLLAERWDTVQGIIGEIPSREELEELYRDIGAKTTLADIAVNESALPYLLAYSPYVRNRLTLMHIRQLITDQPL